MIVIRLKIGNGRLRAGSPVDWSNPITKNLVGAYIFDDATQSVLIDSAGVAGNCTQGGSAGIVKYLNDAVYGPAGRFGSYGAITPGRWYQNTTYNLPTANTSIVQVVQTTTNIDGSTFGNLDANSAAAQRFQCNCPFSGTVYFDFGGTSSPNRVSFTPAGSFFNVWHTMVWTAGASGMAIWVDGVSQASSGSAASRTNTVSGFGIGGTFNDFDHASNNASIALHLLYTRILTTAEIAVLSRNPYAVFVPQPQTRGIRYFVSAVQAAQQVGIQSMAGSASSGQAAFPVGG